MTGRLPFNPDRMKSKQTGKRAGNGGDKPPASVLDSKDEQTPLSVSQLATRIDHSIKSGISGSIAVVGEISSLSHRTHYYFSLKDDRSVIGAVVFASAASRMGYVPKHGDSVVARGRVEFYAPSGRVSLIVTSLTPVGAGALEQQLKARMEELRSKGWFDPANKQPLPIFPHKVAVVTSKDGAAVADVIDTFSKRCQGIELLIVDVRVQGDQARGQVSKAIELLNVNSERFGIDAILLTRGGGSLEDLWAFNELEVARAIYQSSLPVVAAIGHETDTTVAELVADERCATPTQAAMRLSPDREAMREQLDSVRSRLDRNLHSELRYERQRLNTLAGARSISDPSQLIGIHRDRLSRDFDRLRARTESLIAKSRSGLDRTAIRLARHQPAAAQARREEQLKLVSYQLSKAISRAVRDRKEDLLSITRELHAIGPAQVIARGYSVSAHSDGSLIRSVGDVNAGDQIVTTLADGKIYSNVSLGDSPQAESKHEPPKAEQQSELAQPTKAPKRSSRKSRTKSDATNPDQMGLFG